MSHLSNQTRSFLPILFQARLFEALSPETCRRLASKVVLNQFKPGEIIQAEGAVPMAVRCVVQGQVRIVGSANQGTPTVALLNEGDIFGWEACVRKTTCGSIRAAGLEEVLTLSLLIDDFEAIALSELLPTLIHHISPIEVYELLTRFCDSIPTRLNLPNLAELSRYILSHDCAIAAHWFGELDTPIHLSADYTWFVSGAGATDLTVGTIVGRLDQISQFKRSLMPVRLIGIDRNLLASVVSTGLLPAPNTTLSSSSNAVLEQLENLMQPLITPSKKLNKVYPSHSAHRATFAESVVIAFWNICEYLNVPYRPELLRQWGASLETQPRHQMNWYVGIAEAFGLSAQVVKFPATPMGLARLQTPAIVMVDAVPAVLYEAEYDRVILASSKHGLTQILPSALVDRLTVHDRLPEAPISLAVVLARQPQSRTDQFGWWWLIGFF